MIKVAEKTELNQISLTGIRSLVLLGLLIEAPRSLEEIRDVFTRMNVMEDSNSDDILRIDLNTLRTMGCEITRASAKTNYKYVLINHPFALNITSEEISTIRKVYKRIKDSGNLVLMFKYDELFKKLANYVSDIEVKEELYGISALKSYKINFVKELFADCKAGRQLELIYRTPEAKADVEKSVSALKLVYQNDKLYLYGYDHLRKESVILNVKRIRAVLSRSSRNGELNVEPMHVQFFLKSFGVSEIEENENVIETQKDGVLVEGSYHNEFVAMQRILSFGSACTVSTPKDFKQKVIQKLKDMRKVYHE